MTTTVSALVAGGAAGNPFLTFVNWDHPTTEQWPDDPVARRDVFDDVVALNNGEGSINQTAGQAARNMFPDAAQTGVGRYKISSAYRRPVS